MIISLSLSSYAQRAKLFTTDSELPNSLIYQIHQDSKGLIWIATEDGLCRYDGAKITTYKHGSSSIINNYVKLIFEDSKDRLFFGFFNGLQIYDHATDSFKSIPLILENMDSFDAHLLTMIERENGDILIGSAGLGIYKLNEDSTHLVAYQRPDLTSENLIKQLFEDNHQNLWISTIDNGLLRLTNNMELISYSSNPKLVEISSIVQDEFDDIYVGSSKNGLFKYNQQNDDFEQIESVDPLPIITLLDRKKGNDILIGTDGMGIKYFDQKTNQISDLNFNISNLDLSTTKVHSILEDDSDNTWLGLFQKGVALIPSLENNFNYIGHQSVKYDLIGSMYTLDVTKEKDKTLWVATDGEGVYKINSKLKNGEPLLSSKNYPSSPKTVLDIFLDTINYRINVQVFTL